MKKIIVSMADQDAIEVRENNRLAPRYGMTQLSFQSLVVKEREVIRSCENILKTKELPLLVRKLNEFSDFSESQQGEEQDFFPVLTKATGLLKKGFHVLIVTSMLGCAGGSESHLGYGTFDEKFFVAYTDPEARKEFWGTVHLLPIEMVRTVLIDLMNNVRLDDLCEDNVQKSELVSSWLSRLSKEKQEIAEFVKFCA